MKKTHTSYQGFRASIQLLWLAAFIVLLVQGQPQLWLAVFIVTGAAASFLFGRVFCGWICPMGTLLRFQTWIFRTLKIPRRKLQKSAAGDWMRWIMLLVFLGILVFSRQRGMQIPLLPGMTAFAVLVSCFFHESFWHRKLCPFGALLSVSSRRAWKNIHIHKEGCMRCGKCQRVCPSESIDTDSDKLRYNTKKECLVCRSCIGACPTGTITYETGAGSDSGNST